MKLHRLRVSNFAAIREAEINFGKGLNVLYGPNDLGKSTLVHAIRLALLLPHSSTSIEQYIAWTGGRDPVVELTFETEQNRIWRVRKEFGKGGSSLLQESKNGKDFDDVERARKVDGRLREILRWGIPEPGGSGAGKGLPNSFLSTALLSTQSDVAAILNESLENDSTGSGREQIAAALEAVAQDPLFICLLRNVQERRDEAYTDKGAKKTAKGSVFKIAADRVKETREEKERLQRTVDDSEGAEAFLMELLHKRDQNRDALATAGEQLAELEKLATQVADRSAAAELVRCAQAEVDRILAMSSEIEEGEAVARNLLAKVEGSRSALTAAQQQESKAHVALRSAEESEREKMGASINETVVRQELELKIASFDRALAADQQYLDAVQNAKRLSVAADEAERNFREQEETAEAARKNSSEDAKNETIASSELGRCNLLERALDVHVADSRVSSAQVAVQKKASIQQMLDAVLATRATLIEKRSRMKLPPLGAVAPMRRLAHDLAAARGALDVGLAVEIEPVRPLALRILRDGKPFEPISSQQVLKVEADRELEIGIGDVATLRILGGRRDARERVHALEQQWDEKVVPHLTAAAVVDLDGLDSLIAECGQLDAQIKDKDGESQTLQAQMGPLAESARELEEAMRHAEGCRRALDDERFEPLLAEIEPLGADSVSALRTRRLECSKKLEKARVRALESAKLCTVAEERAKNLHTVWTTALGKSNEALASFTDGVDSALTDAQVKVSHANLEKRKALSELEALDSTIAARKQQLDEALSIARTQVEAAKRATETAQQNLTAAITGHAEHTGRLSELCRMREAQDLSAAESNLEQAKARHAALPVPERNVTTDAVNAAKEMEKTVRSQYDANELEIQRARGRLEQVGGAVARERLRDAVEAFELAEHQEREIEADYEAWKLLLDTMKQADAAQASNLGQALGPTIAALFQNLTQQRYQAVQLGGQLNTEGVVVHGAPRATTLLSVGTREQLSTLYRLALAEYLQTTVVFDDQLVQSDETRMDWFRALLAEKARKFQVVALTCRPSDYLGASIPIADGSNAPRDGDDGFVRAIDLQRVIQRI